MVLDHLRQAATEFERKTGAPPLSKFVETIDKLPNEKRLKLIKQVLETAERVAQTAPALELVIELIKEINSMPMEKIERLEKVLKKIDGIMKKAPTELTDFLTSLKEE